jgi:hypothetical protein
MFPHALSNRKQNRELNPQKMTDIELRIALANELLGWVGVCEYKKIGVGGRPLGFFSQFPIEAPKYPADKNTRRHLEQSVRSACVWQEYLRKLNEIVGINIEIASPRQRAEAALMAVRSKAICSLD